MQLLIDCKFQLSYVNASSTDAEVSSDIRPKTVQKSYLRAQNLPGSQRAQLIAPVSILC